MEQLSGTMNNMNTISKAERGSSILIIPLVISVVLLFGAIGFGGWSYNKMLDYKNNVDTKVALAVNAEKLQEAAAKDAEFAQIEKDPLTTYQGPAAFGSVTIRYPKTWSAYVNDDGNGTPYVDGYFFPGHVPNTNNADNAYALRVQVVQESYSDVLNEVQGNVDNGVTTVVPYKAPKVPTVIGVYIKGKLTGTKSGSMVVLPLRNMTIKLWTEATSFQNDFDTRILPNFTFAP